LADGRRADEIGCGMIGFWLASGGAAGLAFLLCRRWSHLALFVLPLSVAFPWALSESEGVHGSRFPGVQIEQVLGACALVLLANLVGMRLGKFRFVFFTLYPGRDVPSRKGREDDPS
jgi:hypothetical protein